MALRLRERVEEAEKFVHRIEQHFQKIKSFIKCSFDPYSLFYQHKIKFMVKHSQNEQKRG